MKREVCLVAVACLFTLGASSIAERPEESPEDATYVVVGKVAKIFTHTGKENREYVVQLRIESVEKGQGYKKGEYIYAYVFQRRADAPREPSASGHRSVPSEGTRIRAWIKRRRGEMEGLYSKWYEALE